MQISNNPVFYDFEVSRAIDGFPIEVGWAFVDNDQRAIHAEAHLICPDTSWDLVERWDGIAESLHGINRTMLMNQGESAYQVASRMNAALSSSTLFADSALDERWLDELFDAAGVSAAFEVRRSSSETLIRSYAQSNEISPSKLDRIIQAAHAHAPQTHRALPDATHWAWIWRAIQTQAF
jgi:hypothetical protein